MLPPIARRAPVALLLAATAIVACKDNGPRSHFVAPAVNPIIDSAMPASLRGAASSATAPSFATTSPANLAQAAILSLHQGIFFSQTSGKGYKGFLHSLVSSIDDRMLDVNTQVAGIDVAIPCLNTEPTSYTVDLSTIDPMLSIPLTNARCVDPFVQNITGSGDIFGSDDAGNNYSLMLSLGQSTTASSASYVATGGSIVAVNVSNYLSDTRAVDGMVIQWSPLSTSPKNGAPIGNDLSIVRFKASPSTKHFELFFASTSPDAAASAAASVKIYLGGGFRMITDGAFLYADGLILDPTNPAANYQPFTVCIDVSQTTLPVDATGAGCSILKGSFTFAQSARLTMGAISGTTIAQASWPGSAGVNNQLAPSAAIQALLNGVFPVTAAKGVPLFVPQNGTR